LVDSSFQSDGGEQLQQQQQQQQQQQAHGAAASGAADSRVELRQQQILKRALSEVGAFRLPHQTNRLSLLFGPHISPAVSCTLGVEVFERGHVTPLHVHTTAHELFFVLAGTGEAVFGSSSSSSSSRSAPASGGDGHKRQQHHAATRRVPLSAGDVVVFSPGVLHGVDNLSSGQLYCLQMMLPNESFAEYVRSGELAGTLDVGAVFAASHCG
jgi:mannose-6-phosphate isomerase-like protein (cupin superfamily)